MTGPGENTYCRVCGVRAAPGQRDCANCGAVLPATPNTVRTDAMRRALALARRGPSGVNPQVGAVLLIVVSATSLLTLPRKPKTA